MLALILLCLVILSGTYLCLKASGESMDVTFIQSFEDYFLPSKTGRNNDHSL